MSSIIAIIITIIITLIIIIIIYSKLLSWFYRLPLEGEKFFFLFFFQLQLAKLSDYCESSSRLRRRML